ncbi:hypothetical protein E3P89_02753 [Wallemia ichthyophaga]|uniref:Arrestin C-terminal-like domain-containing protein n=1 Tax=Wallemia ichthyophaga TaxID=245174 RepID=A0A4T0H9X9_WALIC|nr:hypothetical protein E3P90_02769 [Wallemia ichthyophaga]TIB10831.1 hypothetical protein E3P93_02777 [Wallemia ichthyophaga]TIB21246.1 hypothetical protein E3P89_02753 [Wallemia ichthyophaga]TIB22932.1 hypothetical protein E3P88_02788 [Wallemia ichthyophaga]
MLVDAPRKTSTLYRKYGPRELYEYNGTHPHKPILIAIGGIVFDVSKGASFYGPDGPYGNFAGRDASRGMAMHSFDDQVLTPIDQPPDKLQDLTADQVIAMNEWISSSRTDVPSAASASASASAIPPPTPRTCTDHPNGPSKIEIEPQVTNVVLQGLPGDSTPYTLRGLVKIHLSHSTEFKDIVIQVSGKCRTNVQESFRSHTTSDTHVLIDHKHSVLTKSGKHHQTLAAGRHTFSFQLDLPSELPASLQLINGSAEIKYKLKAHAYRPHTFQKDLHSSQPINIIHGLPSEALEFSQTLDIENIWPQKILYAITLPHKAFAAGDSIPISIKLTPILKGVKVTQLTTIIKEYAQSNGKHCKQDSSRIVSTYRHHFSSDGEPIPVEVAAFRRADSTAASTPPNRSLPSSPSSRPVSNSNLEPVRSLDLSNPPTPAADPSRSSRRAMVGWADNDPRFAEGPEDLTELNDGEVDTVINVHLPTTAVPSHQYCGWPVYINHKIKWSCMIQNRDGHQSELRCALPIHILSRELLQETVVSTANARRALFGESAGAPDPQTADEAATAAATADLPSYSNHIYDRVPNANVVTSGTVPSGYGNHTYSPLGSPGAHMSPVASRPATPGASSFAVRSTGGSTGSGAATPPDQLSPSAAGQTLPTRPQMSWADSEFYLSLGEIERAQRRNQPGAGGSGNGSPKHANHNSNSQSNAHSLSYSQLPSQARSPGSSRNVSRSQSHASSRAGSPEPGERESGSGIGRRGSEQQQEQEGDTANAISLNDDDDVLPAPSEGRDTSSHSHKPSRPSFGSSHSLNNLFGGPHSGSKLNLHLPKALRPLTSFKSHSHSHSHTPSQNNSAGSSKLHSPTASHFAEQGGQVPEQEEGKKGERGEEGEGDDVSALNRVPSYDVASRGFLGGGVVPLPEGLPTYDESQTNDVQRSSTLDADSMKKLREAMNRQNQGVVSGSTQNQSLNESLSHMNLGQQGGAQTSQTSHIPSRSPSRASRSSDHSHSRRPHVKFTLEHDSEDEEGA